MGLRYGTYVICPVQLDPYRSKQSNKFRIKEFGLGGSVVMSFLSNLSRDVSSKIYVDSQIFFLFKAGKYVADMW